MSTVLECVDAYIIDKDVWVKVGHLSVPAYNMAAVTSNGAVYLVGGVDHSGQPLRLIQCFVALRSGLYSAFKVEVPNMPPSLLSARAVTSGLEGVIYIVCGHGEVNVYFGLQLNVLFDTDFMLHSFMKRSIFVSNPKFSGSLG